MDTQPEYESKKGTWSQEEDKVLLDWVQKHGSVKWTECSKRIPGRCGKQCRERWVNILNPDVKKGNWKDEEQQAIFEGLKRAFSSWSYLSKSIPGRTENSIKNYFYSSIRRIKSNIIFNDLKKLYTGQVTREELKKNREDDINKELQKMNIFCMLIAKYLLWESQPGEPFNEFISSIIFVENNSIKSGKSRQPSIKVQEEKHSPSTPTRFFSHKDSPQGSGLQLNLPSPEKAKSIINILKTLSNESSMTKFVPVLKYLESQIWDSQVSQEDGKTTIHLPKCWNCRNNICLLHKPTEKKEEDSQSKIDDK